MKTWLSAFLVLAYAGLFGQGFSGKTIEIQLDNKKPLPDSKALPSIEWTSPPIEFSTSTNRKVDVECIISSITPMKSVQLIIGDNTTGVEGGSKEFEITDPTKLRIKQQLTLSDGSNFIRVRIENTDGAIVTSTRTVIIGMDAVALAIDRKDYALMFATDKYDHWDDLVNPIEDTQAIASELTSKFGFQVEMITNATQEQVFEKIREYNQRTYRPQDQILIFFAGHGTFDETFGEGFVVARNSLANDKGKTTYISHNRLRGIVNNIPCEHILLAMDVCFGGTLDPEIARARGADAYEDTPTQMVVRKLSQKTRKYLTSGGKEYVSDGIPGKHSPFAGKFIESLRSYGGTDKVLTLQELITSMEVLRQTPRSGSFGDDMKLSDFVFLAK